MQIGKKQYDLGPDKETAFAEYHRLMAAPVEVDGTLVAGVVDGFLTWEKGKRSPWADEFGFVERNPIANGATDDGEHSVSSKVTPERRATANGR